MGGVRLINGILLLLLLLHLYSAAAYCLYSSLLGNSCFRNLKAHNVSQAYEEASRKTGEQEWVEMGSDKR